MRVFREESDLREWAAHGSAVRNSAVYAPFSTWKKFGCFFVRFKKIAYLRPELKNHSDNGIIYVAKVEIHAVFFLYLPDAVMPHLLLNHKQMFVNVNMGGGVNHLSPAI
ncbi:MAG: hypothetical protein LBP50_02505 [Tannerella sp.]|nr:hypothetical protein [Tannerella sp.]